MTVKLEEYYKDGPQVLPEAIRCLSLHAEQREDKSSCLIKHSQSFSEGSLKFSSLQNNKPILCVFEVEHYYFFH